MKIGYVRVSKQEQHEALQIDALKEAGCEKWFLDKMTGSKAERKGLDGTPYRLLCKGKAVQRSIF
jgi:DNA invertase Pin-like site-specific DNA recombinase